MVIDEPAMWNLIPEAKRDRVLCAAQAMCRSKDACDDEDDESPNHCAGCDTPEGGSCVAFGLYGHMAIEVVEALDTLKARASEGKLSSENRQFISGEDCPHSGWADATLASAYMKIEALSLGLAQPTESGISEALRRALDAIEEADEELGSVTR